MTSSRRCTLARKVATILYLLFLSMAKLYENAKTYAQILKNCSSSQVSEWKFKDVSRAFQWAEYFQKVQGHIASKASVIRKLNARLGEIGRKLGVRFGEEELSYDFLSRSSTYFTKCLLDNPALPKELHDVLTEQNLTCTQKHLAEAEDSKLLFSTLSALHERLVKCCNDGDTILKDLSWLDAVYLRKDIQWLLAGQETSEDNTHVNKRLCSLALVDGGMEVILISLLQDEDGMKWLPSESSHPDSLDAARRAIFHWLVGIAQCSTSKKQLETQESNDDQQQAAISEALWQRSHCNLLAQISLGYYDFFKEYFQFLVRKTREIEKMRSSTNQSVDLEDDNTPSIADDDEREGGAEQHLHWARSHWMALALAGNQLREVCLSFLTAESQQLQVSHDQLTHGEHTLKLVPPEENSWVQILGDVHSALSISSGKNKQIE